MKTYRIARIDDKDMFLKDNRLQEILSTMDIPELRKKIIDGYKGI